MVVSDYGRPVKVKRHNIGTEETPNMVVIRDYWYKETVTQVVYFLNEYEDLFPWSFLEMKGIAISLGAMKISLKPNAKSVKRTPYSCIKPKYKEKV
jgi:hypothetical protein